MPERRLPTRHRNAGQIATYYLPVLVGLLVVLLIVILLPSVVPTSATTAAPSSSSSASAAAPISYPAGDAPEDPGVSAGGVKCGHGARQVTWSHYAPLCQPAYAGTNNGGATAPGVTATTITLTFRFAATPAEVAMAESLAPGALGTEPQAVQLANDYVKLFNQDFDLYGRHVVLKVFTGQGDILLETGGQDQPQAEADAATAKSLGAFADASAIFNTTLYDNALAQEGIISVGGLFQSAKAMRSFTPYEYSPGPDCEKASVGLAQVIGRTMVGKDATFAGDAATRAKKRVFGMLVPDTPTYTACSQTTINILESEFHVKMAGVVHYGVTSLAGTTEADNAIAQFKSEGVTSVLCACDPIYPIYFTAAANAQHYNPEWLALGFGDAFSRLPAQNQWAHAISAAVGTLPAAEQEAYRAYYMVDKRPIPPAYSLVYEPLLLFFSALQAAGPDLTPKHFQAGLESLPTSTPGGQYGTWSFGPGTVDPANSFQELQWDPTAVSPQDGIKGTWITCDGGRSFSYTNASANLPAGSELTCPISF